jgi:light-regulated signal transduction histidine kinase (bacteriophytochrome)
LTDEQTNPEKALTALEESRRELESLTYTIAHDLRAPLRSIEGFARALSEDCGAALDADGQRYLQHVLDASQRMSLMLEGLLSLARIQRAESHPAPLELSSVARALSIGCGRRSRRVRSKS